MAYIAYSRSPIHVRETHGSVMSILALATSIRVSSRPKLWVRSIPALVSPLPPVDPGYGRPAWGPTDPGFGNRPPIDPGYWPPDLSGAPRPRSADAAQSRGRCRRARCVPTISLPPAPVHPIAADLSAGTLDNELPLPPGRCVAAAAARLGRDRASLLCLDCRHRLSLDGDRHQPQAGDAAAADHGAAGR